MEPAAVEPVSGESTAPDVHSEPSHQRLLARIQRLPASVGFVLMGVGVAGLIIPGPFGTPFIITGGLILAPRIFRSVDRFVQVRFPNFYDTGMQAVERFLSDMEKRYPRHRAAESQPSDKPPPDVPPRDSAPSRSPPSTPQPSDSQSPDTPQSPDTQPPAPSSSDMA